MSAAGWWPGAQSAVHYYLTCIPCSHYSNRRKLRNQAKRDRVDRRAYEMQNPNAVRQPSPFRTNINWSEEIALGPGPPGKTKRGKKADNASQRALIHPETLTQTSLGLQTEGTQSSVSAHGAGLKESKQSSEGGRYQREDEDLWGLSTMDSRRGPVRQGSLAGTSLGLPGMAPNQSPQNSGAYYYARNPPINEMHPPIVSSPVLWKHHNTWLKQPPPPAKVMEGKVRASESRSRSGSGTSSRRDGDVSLGHKISARVVEEKRRRGETPDSPTPASRQGRQRHGGENTLGPYSMNSHRGSRRNERRREDNVASEDSTDTVLRKIRSSDEWLSHFSMTDSGISGIRPTTADARLDNTQPSEDEENEPLDERPPPPTRLRPSRTIYRDFAWAESDYYAVEESPSPLTRRRSPTVVKDDSLKVLQELVSPNAQLNPRFVRSPRLEARIGLPAADENEQEDLRLPEAETWLPGANGAGTAKAAHPGKDMLATRDPRMRWSFDL